MPIQLLASVSIVQASISELKDQVTARVDRLRPELERIGRAIHANPEIGYEERQAVAWLTEFLRQHGFSVEIGVGGKPPPLVANPRQRSGTPVGFPAAED